MKRITARHPNGEAYVKICPTLEEELNSGSPLASVIIGEALNVLADLEDEEERRGGYGGGRGGFGGGRGPAGGRRETRW